MILFHVFNRFFHLIFLLPLASASVYVPGTPGAPWSQDELLIVKSKLYALFNKNKDIRAPVMLRLGFHDCLKYADGSGGCDGCLNWEGMGSRLRFSFPAETGPQVLRLIESHNFDLIKSENIA